MPQKNPYLTKYKENVGSQQRLLRQRLGQAPDLPSTKKFDIEDPEDFPSIDDETAESVEKRTRNRYDYFENDAEESLRFFKKNLLANEPNKSHNKSVPTSFDHPTRVQQGSTGGTQSNRHSIDSTKGESMYLARSRAPLEISDIQEIIDTKPNYDVRKSITQSTEYNNNPSARRLVTAIKRSVEPIGTKKTALKDRNSIDKSLVDVDESYNQSKSSAERQKLSRHPSSGISDDQSQEINLMQLNKSTRPKTPESIAPSETFSRKPIYNSLLRAHDSIRLKVNRPKVRPKSETGHIQDTELDDSIQLADIDSTSDALNERAVDVKRRSSKKKSKIKETKVDTSETKDVTPVRNFSEVRIVKVVRTETERSLGVTVRAEDGNIVVARILDGSLADKQGALQVGDVILAVNNNEVYTPEQLQGQLRKTNGDDTILLKIVPSFREELPTLCIYLRALFNYDPNEDSLLPCKEVGVAFNQGDILEVVNQEDPNWWQARRVDSENLQSGLIPSQELEERRRAFVIPDYDLATRTSICGTKVSRKSKKKELYNVGQNCDFDRAELLLYEEVCRTPAFERRTLVLIGANGVGKQALKAKLITMDPERFGTPLPHTSRLPRDGEMDGIHYHFVTREKMEEDIIAGKYLEHGEYEGALYGTKLDSVREIIGSGRVCVLDCSPTCLKVLKTSDYLPFVAFIAAPTLDQLRYMHDWNRGAKNYATFDRALSRQSRRAKTLQDFAFDFFEDEDLQVTVEESARLFRIYEKYFDIVLVNNDFSRTFEALRDAIAALSMASQWIPISWIYGT